MHEHIMFPFSSMLIFYVLIEILLYMYMCDTATVLYCKDTASLQKCFKAELRSDLPNVRKKLPDICVFCIRNFVL